jgi:ATP-dependent DNA helicase RecG
MLEQLIVEHKSKNLEFKENAQSLPNIIKTVVAFANTAGGTIIIGIEDATKEVIGQ